MERKAEKSTVGRQQEGGKPMVVKVCADHKRVYIRTNDLMDDEKSAVRPSEHRARLVVVHSTRSKEGVREQQGKGLGVTGNAEDGKEWKTEVSKRVSNRFLFLPDNHHGRLAYLMDPHCSRQRQPTCCFSCCCFRRHTKSTPRIFPSREKKKTPRLFSGRCQRQPAEVFQN